ncbi:hypothetical protein A3I40_00140 [Candidatus Uhrbacteria bacterium RIFCSPLOWO2_02_FULL_48_12]|uniref:Glycosyltransferase subfamily 4-like N-terminal domain-containing protein n=1 Tax=Candidatus Uhrbacteria bacterium RIFCSPLOWO2_02_FULL_48_12 TaxID=1802407 RepID=A0A1F7VBK4_9BACT|nr:MAG: hypothetical protein A3I40_00140 [Candidatus Uhrbacteria bacterium RIFCSPLOWO2_02_FULL_48_12]
MARIRLGLDLRLFGAYHSGLGRYAEELLNALVSYRHDLDIVVFVNANYANKQKLSSLGLEVREAPYRAYSWQEQWYFPRQLSGAKLDLMHFPHFNVPLMYRAPYVVTIHDLIMHHFPWRVASQRAWPVFWLKHLGYRLSVRQAVSRAAAVIAVSYYTAEDILTYYPKAAGRLRVITEPTPAFDVESSNNDNWNELAYNIKRPYILVVGNFYPHKNLQPLLRVWQRLYPLFKRQLVIVGRPDAFAEGLRALAKSLGLVSEDRESPVRFLGFIEDNELRQLYGQAEFFLTPSLMEGVGLPGLEALATGTPVVSSPNGALPETYGRLARYIGVDNDKVMYRALYKVLTEVQTLPRPRPYKSAMTLEQMAAALEDCYREAMQSDIHKLT